VQYALWALGAVQVLRWRNAARRRHAAERAAAAPAPQPAAS
jgi:hypothetical protein